MILTVCWSRFRACLKSWKTADEIETEYGKRPEGAGEDNEDTFPVYDFFDETQNTVVMA